MKRLRINLYSIWLLSGLLINWSASKKNIFSEVTNSPPINTPLHSVAGKTFTALSPNMTTDRRQQIVYSIGKSLCPYNDYCRRSKEDLFFTHHPCCEVCSCEDNCWETQTCCPDKEVIDTREPVEICHVSIVKKRKKTVQYNGINYGIKAYRVIDDCPESEQNASIINKCTLIDIDHITDYNWVSNNSTGTIYQNKFCAACHGETGLTEWRMEARCKDILHSNFSQLKSLLLSEKCDVINREPSYDSVENLYKRCAIPFYTHCNQTGLWKMYDPDIDWACNVHDATFLEQFYDDIDLYKNAFCYACNQRELLNATTICKTTVSNIRDDGGLVFSSLIDYKRDDFLENYQPDSEFACKVDEMFDPYLQTCRTLTCPFANVPFYGKCKQLVEQSFGLSVEVMYTLTVVWSSMDVFLTDEMATFQVLGNKLLRKLQNDVFSFTAYQCRFCRHYLRLVKNIEKSTNSYNDSDINIGNDPNLLFYSLWHTDEFCNLQKLTNDVIEFSEAFIQIEDNGERALSLKVALLKEDTKSLILSGKVIAERQIYPDCFVMYKLKTEKICPQTKISFSEFEHFMTEHNAHIIKSMFTTVQMRSKDYKEICVADYLQKLSDGNFKVIHNSGSFQSRMKRLFFVNTIVLIQWILMIPLLLL